jgi:hypothetical protein
MNELPELALIAAVLGQAVRDTKNRKERDSAWRWIRSNSPRPFGFCWCCSALGLSPEWAREKIESKKIFRFCPD